MNTLGLDGVDECDPPSQALLAPSSPASETVARGGGGVNKEGVIDYMTQVDLADLFSDLSVSRGGQGPSTHGGAPCVLNEQNKTHMAKPIQHQYQYQQQKQQPQKQGLGEGGDPLDTFFSSVPSNSPVASGVTNDDGHTNDLFDFSRPGERARYTDERSLLEAFENQGKGKRGETRDGPSLSDLSRGSSENKVKARLLKIMNYYDILGVNNDATTEEIRKSYRRKALELHPDRVGRSQTPEEAELFKVMTKAHEILCDTEERAKYDEELRRSGNGTADHAAWLFHLHQS